MKPIRRSHGRAGSPIALGAALLWTLIEAACATGAIALLAIPHGVSAQALEGSKEQTPRKYTRAIRVGLREFELGNFAEARAQLLEAHRLLPNARTLRGLGKVEFELKHYRTALDYFEDALASDVRPLDSAQRAEVDELLEQSRGYIATLTVTVKPAEARLVLDGQSIELQSGGLVLEVGDHVLEAHADGYHSAREMLSVVGRDDHAVELTLLPVAATTAAAAPAPAEPTTATTGGDALYGKWWVWTVAGVAVAAVAVGALLVVGSGGKRLGPEEQTSLDTIGTVQLLGEPGR